jgi:hypothetical protein
MNGKDLREAIRQSGIPIKEIEKKTEIKERTIYSLYDKEKVEDHYLKKIEAAGVKLHKTANDYVEDSVLADVVKMLKTTLAMVESDNETLTRIVNLCLDHDVLVADVKKAKAVIKKNL